MLTWIRNRPFLFFAFKFIFFFIMIYGGMQLLIGFTAPGGYYSVFLDNYFNLIAGLRSSLITGAKTFLHIFGIESIQTSDRVLRIPGGRGVIVSYSCLGIAVMSFWIALMGAMRQGWKTKLIWIVVGLLMIWLINVSRIALFLLAINKGWPMPLGIDHHMWFNIVSYVLIFTLLFFYDRIQLRSVKVKRDPSNN